MRSVLATTINTTVLSLALATAACTGDIDGEATWGPEGNMEEDTPDLTAMFSSAAEEFGVPADLLASIGYVETRWEMVEGHQEFEGMPAAFGIMALRGEELARGAALAGVSQDDVRHDERSNIRAAAALLSSHADELGLDRGDINAWAPAVARFSGIEDEEGQADYVVDHVYGVLQTGAQVLLEGGLLLAEVAPIAVDPDFPEPPPFLASSAVDFPGAVWTASPNHNARPAGNIGKVAMVIIHTCEGAYSGCRSWLRNPAAGASAHYVVNESGSQVSQLVREARRAWHIGANYNCANNSNTTCWRNGYSSNHFTVGIEHGGFASQKSFANGMIEKSAQLTCNITRRHGIPRDRFHIVGHGQLQPWDRWDPGPNWPWTHYINRVRAHCGDGGGGGGGGGTIVVDSNNSLNNQAVARMAVSSNWKSANSTAGYYGTGYWWASTAPVSDAASFSFYLPADATRTIDAWWTAGANRSNAAPFIAFDPGGREVGRSVQNQRVNGQRWVTLGTWHFKRGWNRVVLSRWAPEGSVVIADAIRVR